MNVTRKEYKNDSLTGLKGYIQRMSNGVKLTYDIIANGETVATFFDVVEAKEFCLANRLGVKICN